METAGEIGSGRSVLATQQDDDDDDEPSYLRDKTNYIRSTKVIVT